MIVVAFIVGMLIGYVLFIFPTKWLKIERVQFSLGLNCKILQISDLHVERLRITPEKLNETIHMEAPDIIVLTGDFTRKERWLPRLAPYLEVFQGSGRPVYAVLGNHDYTLPDVNRLVAQIEQYRIKVLRNEKVRLENFELIGIDDYYTSHSDVEKAFQDVDEHLPQIVITHDPNVVLMMNRPFTYLMAGHFHGKQFNVPFLFKLKPMGKLPTLGIYKDLHRNAYGTFYISKGIGQSGFNLRLFVRSEVTVHEL